MRSIEIRDGFLEFFSENGHRVVPSASLVPGDDPTLLFTNAGMNQFKACFTGEEKRDYRRAASSQRCVRAGGKHNDLENVGFTARHHTFFEMLGNFSFGDYFKEEAIVFAWDLLVGRWGLDPSRMAFTVFGGGDGIPPDEEGRELWGKVSGAGDDRIMGLGLKDNFWAMGDTGPCGPCSEIHYYQGDDLPCMEEAAGRRCLGIECECDRWLEVWNLVFMQFERSADGVLKPLPAPSIDTGMGLERLTALLQGVDSNYETDLLRPIIKGVEEALGRGYGERDDDDVSMRVIADHTRAGAFLIADGVYPSNEGRGYVLRRILRRGIRHAKKLGFDEPFIHSLVPIAASIMGEAHPVLVEKREIVIEAIRREEETFLATIERGLGLLEEAIAGLGEGERFPGETAFKLYDTFGFPLDLTEVILAEREIELDREGFERGMEAQRERSRSSASFEDSPGEIEIPPDTAPTEFAGYLSDEIETRVIGVHGGGIILEKTPFYPEGGGQVSDTGTIKGKTVIRIRMVKKTPSGVIVHFPEGPAPDLTPGEKVVARIETSSRRAAERHHTATHILHYALRKVLGEHVAQAGSYVGPDRLRFDFSHPRAMSPQEITEVERIANRVVVSDGGVEWTELPIEEARRRGALAFFGEKYGDIVRMVETGGVSKELCGGTHVRRTGEIGLIKITHESAIAAGIRRIEAVAGMEAFEWTREREEILVSAASALSAPVAEVRERLTKLLAEKKAVEKRMEELERERAVSDIGRFIEEAVEVGEIRLVRADLGEADAKTVRIASDAIRKRMGSGIVVAGGSSGGKAAICVQVSNDLTGRIGAGDLIKPIAAICGGGGGGRPEMAQAGGKAGEKVPEAIRAAAGILGEKLGV